MLNPSTVDRGSSPMERERTVVTGLLMLQLVLWLGFAVHRSPRFPGSLPGAVLAISGAVLMVVPSLMYAAAKRIPSLKRRLSGRLPLRRLLAWHVYGGIVGSVLAILHTGHRFDSTLGIALTGVMLLVVFSGYVGRHFLPLVSLDLREKQDLLDRLVSAYNAIAGEMMAQPQLLAAVAVSHDQSSFLRRRLRTVGDASTEGPFALAYRATQLADSIAELEYTIKAHDVLKGRFTAWLTVHIAASVAFYALLALHVWASVYFGLRWLA